MIAPIENVINAEPINALRVGLRNQGSRKISGLRQRINPTQPKRGMVAALTEGMKIDENPRIAAAMKRIAIKKDPIGRESLEAGGLFPIGVSDVDSYGFMRYPVSSIEAVPALPI